MAANTRALLKLYFETGDKPTEAQFAELIDSFLSLLDDTSDDIPEGTVKRFMTPAEKTKLSSITEVVSSTIDTGALSAGVEATVTHSLGVTVASTILVVRDFADTNNIQVASIYADTVDSFKIKSNVAIGAGLKVKLIGLKS